jgi:threonine dehydrogenase-like Zn-dependent dehydrogenase
MCGSDLWPYRGIQPIAEPTPIHEYSGMVEEVGSAVRSIRLRQFLIGSLFASDSTCPNSRLGYPSSCQQAEVIRVRRHQCCGFRSQMGLWYPPRT